MCRIFEKGVAKPWPVPPFRREEEAAACFPQNGSSFSRQSSHLPQDFRGPRNLMTMRRQTRFVMRPTLAEKEIEWKGWYSLRRFLGTAVRMNADGDTMAKALGNSKAVAEKHYLKPTAVLPDVRRAVNDGCSGLVQ